MKKTRKEGFVRTIVLIIIAIILLTYFGDDIKKFLASDQAKDIVKGSVNFIHEIWIQYIRAPFEIFWNKVVIEIIWDMLLKPVLEYLKSKA